MASTNSRPSRSSIQSTRSAATTTAGRVKIKPPTTTNDTGDPTDCCLFDAKRVLRLIEDERYLSAQSLHQSIRDRIQKEIDDANAAAADNNNNDSTTSTSNSKKRDSYARKEQSSRKRQMLKHQKSSKKGFNEANVKALQLLDENEDILNKMEDRCRIFAKAKKNLDVNDDWTLVQTLFGVRTYYRHESDGSMSIKLEGGVDEVSLFDLIAVMREFDLNYLWAPFVTASMTIAHLDKLDTVGWFVIGLPHFGLMRDALFRAIGCDSIYEDGSVLIVAKGITDRPEDGADEETTDKEDATTNDTRNIKSNITSSFGNIDYDAEETRILESIRKDPILDTLDLPPVPTRMGSGRMTIRSVAAQIHVESPTSATTKLVANIDFNLSFIPQSLLDFVMKRICGNILYKMQGAAKKISKDPITNLHAIKIREDKDFYKTFLLPKFRGICKMRGWEMPPISAFGLSEAQLEMADVFISKQKQKSEMKAIKFFHPNNTENNLDEYLESRELGQSTVGEDGPKVRTMPRDSDDMSDISKYSTASAFFRSNPISNYRRQVEEKTHRRKVREIEESRERAAARLKPKSLNEDALSRLKELRFARNRHKVQDQTQMLDENAVDTPCTQVDRSKQHLEDDDKLGISNWTVSLASHGLFTKIFVLQFLMVSLFCLLYLDTAFEKVVAFRGGSFWMERGRDLATLTYMGVAGSVHFILCYVALMYAFSALQLGLIAGKRTRNFYAQYVHYVVAMVSASLIGLGIGKPGIDKAFRWIVWNTYSLAKVAEISLLSKIPDKVVATLQMTISGILSVLLSTQKLFLESNILGRCFVSITKSVFGFILRTMRYPFATFADIAIKQYEGTLDTLPWREDAFFTTRALLSHSAFFLLVLLFLFNLAAKQARKAIYLDNDESAGNSSSNPASSSDIQETKTTASI